MKKTPAFIIGIEHRSGINFLSQIICLHPDFQLPAPLWEDYVIRYSDHLAMYAEKTSERWERWVDDRNFYQQGLLEFLGDGLLAFLGQRIEPGKRMLVKTPVAHHLENFHRLFPHGKMIILIRDGRDLVVSARRTWKEKPYHFWIRRWGAGAKMIRSYSNGIGRELRDRCWKLIRYEDLVNRPEETVTDLLEFLEADPCAYQWEQLNHIPLWGSSMNRDGNDQVHWNPVEKPKDFNSIGRWASWSAWRKLQFKILAGKELIELGYARNYVW